VLLIHGFSLDLRIQWLRPGIVSAVLGFLAKHGAAHAP
jgi:hypothetical protein